MRSKARLKALRKYFGQFFAKVNIEVTKGQQRSNLAKNQDFFEYASLSQELLWLGGWGKEHSIEFELLFRCDAIRFELTSMVLPLGVKKTPK